MSKFNVQVAVRSEIPKGGFRLKVSILELGMYIDGFRGYPSKKVEGAWVIYAPSTAITGNSYKDVVEFNKSRMLWREISEACEQAIEIYTTAEPNDTKSDVHF